MYQVIEIMSRIYGEKGRALGIESEIFSGERVAHRTTVAMRTIVCQLL